VPSPSNSARPPKAPPKAPKPKPKQQQPNNACPNAGRKPGWSLLLNPTPRILEELGYPNADALGPAITACERIDTGVHLSSEGV
jgi:hypothetical protein